MKYLCDGLKENTTLEIIKLIRNGIHLRGIGYLSDALKINHTLKKIYFDESNSSSDSFFDYTPCRLNTDECREYLIPALEINTGITEIYGIDGLKYLLTPEYIEMKKKRFTKKSARSVYVDE